MPRSCLGLLGVLLCALGCGGEVFTSGSGGTGGSGTGGTGTGGSGTGATGTGGTGSGAGGDATHGDCATNTDCPPGAACVAVTSGGFKVCTDAVVEATACTGSGFDECCNTNDCTEGKCLLAPIVPSCGGAQPADYNACAADQCTSDAQCPGGVCLTLPMLGRKVRACLPTQCQSDDDCKVEAGGYCAPVIESCCHTVSGLYCVYPSDGCRSDADCLDGYCQPGLDRAACHAGSPVCPG